MLTPLEPQWFGPNTSLINELIRAGIPAEGGSGMYLGSVIVPDVYFDRAREIAAGRAPIVGNPEWNKFAEQAANERTGNAFYKTPEFTMATTALAATGAAVMGGAVVAGALAPAAAATTTAAAGAATTAGAAAPAAATGGGALATLKTIGSVISAIGTAGSAALQVAKAFSPAPAPAVPEFINLPAGQSPGPFYQSPATLPVNLGLPAATVQPNGLGFPSTMAGISTLSDAGLLWPLLLAAVALYYSRRK